MVPFFLSSIPFTGRRNSVTGFWPMAGMTMSAGITKFEPAIGSGADFFPTPGEECVFTHSNPATVPDSPIGESGTVAGLECVKTHSSPGVGKKSAPEPIAGSNFVIPADMVIPAIGQKPVTEFLRPVKGIELRKNGTIAVNEKNQTGNPKYFAAGDCVNGGKEVVDAVAEGMAAARGLDAWLNHPRATK